MDKQDGHVHAHGDGMEHGHGARICRMNKQHVQGRALNRGLKRFFSIYRPLIKAYIRPEKFCFVWAGPLANHPFNFNLIFLSDGTTAVAERAACFADLYRC